MWHCSLGSEMFPHTVDHWEYSERHLESALYDKLHTQHKFSIHLQITLTETGCDTLMIVPLVAATDSSIP